MCPSNCIIDTIQASSIFSYPFQKFHFCLIDQKSNQVLIFHIWLLANCLYSRPPVVDYYIPEFIGTLQVCLQHRISYDMI